MALGLTESLQQSRLLVVVVRRVWDELTSPEW